MKIFEALAAPLGENVLELDRWQVTHVHLEEPVPKGSRQGLAAAVAAGRVLCGEHEEA